jgi:hypothetical protein
VHQLVLQIGRGRPGHLTRLADLIQSTSSNPDTRAQTIGHPLLTARNGSPLLDAARTLESRIFSAGPEAQAALSALIHLHVHCQGPGQAEATRQRSLAALRHLLSVNELPAGARNEITQQFGEAIAGQDSGDTESVPANPPALDAAPTRAETAHPRRATQAPPAVAAEAVDVLTGGGGSSRRRRDAPRLGRDGRPRPPSAAAQLLSSLGRVPVQEAEPPPPTPVPAPRRPATPGEIYHLELMRQPILQLVDGTAPKTPYRQRPMTDTERELVRQFLERQDPALARKGEYGQMFKVEPGADGNLVKVTPNHPIRYEEGGAVGFESADPVGSHANLHNHPPDVIGSPNHPSVADSLYMRMIRKEHPEHTRALIVTPTGVIAHDGRLPLRYEALVDEGPGHSTPAPSRPPSPEVIPPLPKRPGLQD